MVSLRHTAQLSPAELAAARALCDSAFADFADADWAHALGGMHALVTDDGLPVGVMLAARPAEDELLLSLCAQVEAASPWRDRMVPEW